MKYIKEFNNNKIDYDDIFKDTSLLDDILIEYRDNGFNYHYLYKKFNYFPSENYYMPVEYDMEKKYWNNYIKNRENNYTFGIQVSFKELIKDDNDIPMSSDAQRGNNRRNFSTPNKLFYKFFDITKNVQQKIEQIGYIFMLSTHINYEFDLMIIENKK